ncbi:MAG: type II secretion system protein N [Proteobacteria bacterium]|nr:type II secretion system protein N [Pseudomonadota bacterium]MBU1737037.1 type II secretion system protein N [Pseudomonadota bacterium]
MMAGQSDLRGHGGFVPVTKKNLLLFGLLFLFCVGVRVPADLLWPFMLNKAGFSDRQIQLTSGEGSWLAGSFRRVQVVGRELGSVSWRFRPMSMLAGSLRFDLTVRNDESTLSGVFKAGPGRVGLDGVQGMIPLHLISKIAGLPGIELSGKLTFSQLFLVVKKGRLNSAGGEIFWQDAGMNKPYKLNAGNIVAVLKTDQEGIKINAADKGGELMIRLAGTVFPDGNYSMNGDFATRDSAHPDLVSFLKVMGEPGPDGRVRLSYRGKIGKMLP